ncbi:MAG: cytochrome b/b6 domain-containing protein [Wenzhouxiangella sp.]|nr:cytochrome b/b6 domain-containing protein [Wenzhouxiangella sp.]TVR96102.1 MAG: cytochrome B [Wenzhouxiangellaceae bacterium]
MNSPRHRQRSKARRHRSSRAAADNPQPPEPEIALQIRQVWDLPTRLSHWAIVTLLLIQLMSSQFPLLPTTWHLWAGYLLLLVVLFRTGWGLVGSDSARFGPMLSSLRGLPAYLPLLFSNRPTHWPGHNPVGALSSLLLLALLLISCVSGLFVETWAEYRGPLAERVSRSTSLWLADLHSVIRWPIYGLVLIHIGAVSGYLLFKGEDRIGPIFGNGRIAVRPGNDLQQQSTRRAMVVLTLCLALLLTIVVFGPIA